ncbi:MAG: sigma-70 family RNA polymerase sigma factor [Phycisphaerales bacterium]|nr:sigma-70 family RNA polymerase sigma factor [Phycisphaerales bacterium]
MYEHGIDQPQPTKPRITQYDLDRIDYRVGCLVRRFALTADDADDLRQSMALEVCKALRRFDPSRSARNTYVNRTLDRHYRHVARQLRSRRSHAPWCPSSLSTKRDLPDAHRYSGNGQTDDIELIDLQRDVAVIVASLPPRLRRIASALMSMKPRDAATHLGLHASTVYRAIHQLHDHFTQAGWDEMRQTCPSCRCR